MITDARSAVRRLLRDEGVSEIVSYIFMFGLGAIALTFALNVLSDTTSHSDEIASGVELKQVSEIAASFIQQGVELAVHTGDAGFQIDFDLPPQIGGRGYNITITPVMTTTTPPCIQSARVVATSDDGDLSAEASLGNAPALELSATDCLDLGGTVHSSAGSVRVIYDPDADPEITISATPR